LADSTASGRWAYGNNFVQILRGNVYFNVHTSNNPGGELRANLKVGTGIATDVAVIDPVVPVAFDLAQNFPNPFNPSTFIEYSVPSSGRVTLEIFNVLGQKVAVLVDGVNEPGTHRITFDASRLPSGLYLYRLSGDGSAPVTRRMLLLK
jgi:hypothetical protein